MVDTLRELKQGSIVVADGELFKVAKLGAVTRESNTLLGLLFERMVVRTVPPTFMGGTLDVRHYGEKRLACRLKGDHDLYQKTISVYPHRATDVGLAAVGEGDWMPTYDVKGFTKADLMAYVVAVHGNLVRDDIMRMVAALEALPWIPTSNTEYFGSFNQSPNGTLTCVGKFGRKQLYGLGVAGRERSAAVLARLGDIPAFAVK